MADRRQVPRYLCDLKAELVHPVTQTRIPVSAAILSTQGGAVEDTRALKLKQKYLFILEWQGRAIQAETEIVWKTPEGLAGLRLLSIDEKDLHLLRELLATLRIQPLTKPLA